METLILQTENNRVTKELLALIKNMKSVKFVAVENEMNKMDSLDLTMPGRELTANELEELSIVMESEVAFEKSDEVFNEIVNSLKTK